MISLPPPNEGRLQFADGETEAQRDSLGSKVTPFGPAEWEVTSPSTPTTATAPSQRPTPYSAFSPVLLARWAEDPVGGGKQQTGSPRCSLIINSQCHLDQATTLSFHIHKMKGMKSNTVP